MKEIETEKDKYLIYTPSKELLILEATYGRRREIFVPYLMRRGMDINSFERLETALLTLLDDEKAMFLMQRRNKNMRYGHSYGKLEKTDWIQIRNYLGYLQDFSHREEEMLQGAIQKEHLKMMYTPFDEIQEYASDSEIRMDYGLLPALSMLEEKVFVKK